MSKPKELYRFVEGLSVWTVTSSDMPEVYDGETYVPITIGRSEVESKNELSRANVQVSVDLDNEMGRRWMRGILDEVVGLTILSKDGDDVSVVWKGRLSSVRPEGAQISLVFESVFTSLRRPGLRARYQRSCPHVLYGRGCNLDKNDWASSGTIINVQSTTVIMPEASLRPDGYYTAGMIEAPDGSLRFIVRHIGSSLVLIRPLANLDESFANNGGITARIFPGCNRTKETCQSKFNNLPNYGGFPFIPLRNPFDGSSII